MSRGVAFGPDAVVAKSLGLTRSTHTLVAAVTAAVTANAMIAIQLLTVVGQTAVLAILFVSVAIATYAVSTDVLARSSQTMGNLKSIGANKGRLTGVVLFSVITYGAAGTALGSGLGGVFGMALGRFTGIDGSFLAEALAVFVVAAGATGAGAYVGTKTTWRS